MGYTYTKRMKYCVAPASLCCTNIICVFVFVLLININEKDSKNLKLLLIYDLVNSEQAVCSFQFVCKIIGIQCFCASWMRIPLTLRLTSLLIIGCRDMYGLPKLYRHPWMNLPFNLIWVEKFVQRLGVLLFLRHLSVRLFFFGHFSLYFFL